MDRDLYNSIVITLVIIIFGTIMGLLSPHVGMVWAILIAIALMPFYIALVFFICDKITGAKRLKHYSDDDQNSA